MDSGLKPFSYSPALVPPALRDGEARLVEVAPQVYGFRLFTPAFCREIVEAVNTVGRWETEVDVDRYLPRIHGGPFDTVPERAKAYACAVKDKEYDSACDADESVDSVASIKFVPGLFETYCEIMDRHVLPLAKRAWPFYTARMKRIPYVLRYDAADDSLPTDMNLHWEQAALALAVYLNDDFDGGGTGFPRWGAVAGREGPGWAILYPGGLSHEHGAEKITRGRRYVFLSECY